MDLTRYQELSGSTVTNEALVISNIEKAQFILEDMLGYPLNPDLINENYYDGATPVNAFRIFPFNSKDLKTRIDPATAVHSVRFLTADGETEVVEEEDRFVRSNNGLIQYIGFVNGLYDGFRFNNFRCSCTWDCPHTQIVVDADWAWEEGEIPNSLLMVWANMVSYYSDFNKDVRSETLGSHSYTKFDRDLPELQSHNMKVISKYAGPNGSAHRTLTI